MFVANYKTKRIVFREETSRGVLSKHRKLTSKTLKCFKICFNILYGYSQKLSKQSLKRNTCPVIYPVQVIAIFNTVFSDLMLSKVQGFTTNKKNKKEMRVRKNVGIKHCFGWYRKVISYLSKSYPIPLKFFSFFLLSFFFFFFFFSF